MAVSTGQIKQIIDTLTQEVEQTYEGLSLFFVLHRFGKMHESITLAEHEIISHPAGNAARSIIRKHTNNEKSSFLGLAIAKESKMLGFKKKDHLLGLFNINLDEFNSQAEATIQVYHLIWHAIDLFEIRSQQQYRKKFKAGPMVPKRSPMNLAKTHLQADAFSIALYALKGNEDDILSSLALKRAKNALEPNNNFQPEDFPSVIAMDACKMATKELKEEGISEEEHIRKARQLSIEVGHTFDEENISQWWNFTIPAQDMAWRGFTQEAILGAAIHTSSDPFVRSIGYLIQDITKIEPVQSDDLGQDYNAFIDPEILTSLHKEIIDTVFEDAISQGLEESSNQPFLNAANKQNESLTEGKILGWCASALHDAAQAFDRALLNGASPDQAARMQFEGNKNHPKWETLKELGKTIIDQKRQGFAMSMGHIAEICHNHPAFAPILDSLKITMNDTVYIQKLEAANDLNIIPNVPTASPEPKSPTPAPKGPAPTAPVLSAPAMGGPSLGGSNNRGQHIARQRQLMAQKKQEEDSSSGKES